MTDRAQTAQRSAVIAWLLLAGCVLAWPYAGAHVSGLATGFAVLPLLLPLHGLLAGSPMTLRTAPMALAPAILVAISETLVNSTARAHMGITLVLIVVAFAAVLPVIRNSPRD